MRKFILSVVFTILVFAVTGTSLSAQSKGGPWIFALNLDSSSRSVQVDADPGTYLAQALAPSAAGLLKEISPDQPHSLLTDTPQGGKLMLRRNDGGQVYQYRFQADHIYVLVLLPDYRLEVVELRDRSPDQAGPRVILANSLDQEVQDFQVGTDWQKNVLVRLASIPPRNVSNPARLTWAAAYGIYHAAQDGKFTGLAPGVDRPLFAEGTWWVAVAGSKGIQVSKIK